MYNGPYRNTALLRRAFLDEARRQWPWRTSEYGWRRPRLGWDFSRRRAPAPGAYEVGEPLHALAREGLFREFEPLCFDPPDEVLLGHDPHGRLPMSRGLKNGPKQPGRFCNPSVGEGRGDPREPLPGDGRKSGCLDRMGRLAATVTSGPTGAATWRPGRLSPARVPAAPRGTPARR
jgi:hypothetical protein